MIKEVHYPINVLQGIKPLVSDFPHDSNIRVFGLDTETIHGRAHTIQIADEDECILRYVGPEDVFSQFWEEMRHRLRSKGVNICYAHNLSFELRVMFALQHTLIYEQFHDVKFFMDTRDYKTQKGVPDADDPTTIRVDMLFGKVNTACIKQGDLTLHLFDSHAFTLASLAKSCKMFNLPMDKMEPPKGLGDKPLSDPYFERYAKQDAILARLLGLKIMEFHRRYQVRPSVTLPAFAARVFRRHFLKMNETIPFPDIAISKAAELSYHGGKNGYYLPFATMVEDCYEVDISSAYPYAMTELPPMTAGKFKRVTEYVPGKAGIYAVTGQTLEHRYPLVFDHSFEPLKRGVSFKELWHTGYEVEHMLKPESFVEVKKLWGFVWEPAKGAKNPLGAYVRHFYEKKESAAKTDADYYFYKTMMNSLYGKFASTTPIKSMEQALTLEALRAMGVEVPDNFDISERFDPVLGRFIRVTSGWRAGSLYNPFWASMVTGHARAYLYRLETSLHAVHAATDSVKTILPHPGKKGLGGLKVECYGRCYLFRNKLYLHFCKDSSVCGHKEPPYKYPPGHKLAGKPMVDHDGQHLCKVAMHGYKGPLWLLFERRDAIIRGEPLEYEYTHVVGLREGMKRGETPCDFVTRKETLRI